MSVKVGDKVRCIKTGKTLEITDEIFETYLTVSESGQTRIVTADEYEIITKEEVDSMKAEKGDLIRIIPRDDNGYIGRFYEVGDVLEVQKRDDHEGVIAIVPDGESLYVYDREYVIHRKAGEEDAPKQTRDGFRELQLQVVEGKTPEEAVAISMAELRTEQDAVNHPNHYTQGKFETIEVIEEITKGYDDGFIAYCIGNTLKYIARAPFKHGTPAEDLAKAKRYIEFAIEHLDAKSTQD